jgi:pimeloyl-ACP methyl ester carboxylesterase
VSAVFSQRTRHIAFALVSLFTFIVLAGVTYQSVTTALERQKYPYPGRLIDVGDHQLHIYCTGPKGGPEGPPLRGSAMPTVVLEAPAAGISVGWAWVQGDLSRTTRVCSYDRAGLGWSEAGQAGYDAARVPDELHMLLERAGERGPYVIAGHELGATFARMYATRFRAETAALVLVDDPGETESFPHSMPRLVSAWPWLARVGVLRATGALTRHADGFPDPPGGATRAFLNRPDHLTRGAIEIARREEAMRLAAANPLDPALPVVRVNTSRETLPPVLLGSAERAREVTRALEDAVKRVRP